jgi:hypothetical protein
MRKIVLDKKTGFKNNSPYTPVVIRDYRNMLFYDTNATLPVNQFNLPAGEYWVDSGNIVPMAKPVPYKLLSLPRRERVYPKPYKFKIIFGNNPNKCSIIWEKKVIIFDNSFRDESLPVIEFIRGHEYGHQFYATEKYADWWSANRMLTKGFNPSQIGSAPIASLSDGAFERKQKITNKLIKNAKRPHKSL